MNSPYNGDFIVTQRYVHGVHDGLDLVGITHKEIHAVTAGTVIYSGWENSDNKLQGFGQYVAVKSGSNVWYYGHMSEIRVKLGQAVKIGDVLGIEGNTGRSTGSHCHICVRVNGIKGNDLDVSSILGIPNALNNTNNPYNDGFEPTIKVNTNMSETEFVKFIQTYLNAKCNANLVVDGICGTKTRAAIKKYLSIS